MGPWVVALGPAELHNCPVTCISLQHFCSNRCIYPVHYSATFLPEYDSETEWLTCKRERMLQHSSPPFLPPLWRRCRQIRTTGDSTSSEHTLCSDPLFECKQEPKLWTKHGSTILVPHGDIIIPVTFQNQDFQKDSVFGIFKIFCDDYQNRALMQILQLIYITFLMMFHTKTT